MKHDYEYQQTGQYVAQIADGMEDIGAAELAELGARNITTFYRGIRFEADRAALYRINYCSRLASRILAPLRTFRCRSPDELYRGAAGIDWADFLAADGTFAVFSNVSHSRITHSKYAALRVKDAIVDQFRSRYGKRPDIDRESPGVWFHVFVHEDWATLSADTSGGALHRRGYRQVEREAPMRETLAAAIIRLTEWDGERPLCDPMCGSGTLLCEALMRVSRTPAGFLRERFGFETLPDFDRATWAAVKREAKSAIRPVPEGLISGSDADARAVAAAGENLRMLPGGGIVALRTTAFERIKTIENSVIVTNPPAGIRIGAAQGAAEFIRSFGDFLKQRCAGSTAFVYLSDNVLVKSIGLRTAWKRPLKNGALDGRLVRLDLYS